MEENIPVYPSIEYEKAAKHLLKNVKKASTLVQIRKLFNNFAKKYTVIPYLWKQWILEESNTRYKDYNESSKDAQIRRIKNLSKIHFYCSEFAEYSFDTFMKGKFGRVFIWDIMNRFLPTRPYSKTDPFSTEVFFPALIYPHDRLKSFYHFAKKYSTYPIPQEIKERYNTALKLYLEIKSCEDGRLLHILSKSDDQMIVIENVESIITSGYHQKGIWKWYLEYLKTQKGESNRILNVYSRCSRLFFVNTAAKEKYRNEMEEQASKGKNVSKWWIDTIEFEKDFVSAESARKVLDRALTASKNEMLVKYGLWFEKEYGNMKQYYSRYLWAIEIHPQLADLNVFTFIVPIIRPKIEFNYKNCFKFIDTPKTCTPRSMEPSYPQQFPFRDGIIHYIEKSANASTMLKLQMSAKYFYLKNQSPLCHNLTVLDGYKHNAIFYPHSLFINADYANYTRLPSLTITHALIIHTLDNPTVLSKLLPRLNLLNISHLVLTWQKLTFTEFEILTKLKLKSVKFYLTEIYKDEEILPIEEIISSLTTVKDLSILGGTFTPETSKCLAKLERCIKFKAFEIAKIDENFSCNDFIEFAKKCLKETAKIVLWFSDTATVTQRNEFEQQINKTFPECDFDSR